MKFNYYYNKLPDGELCRNNLIYTSLISEDKKTFVQWYYNDKDYHKNQNQIVDSNLMDEKWEREIKFLLKIYNNKKDIVPEILDIDYRQKKIFLRIENYDFWQLSNTLESKYDTVLPDWQEQMYKILTCYKTLGIYKYSLHPSSYFIVDNQLKSINYFFCYSKDEQTLCLQDVMSHISDERQADLFPKMESMGIRANQPTPLRTVQMLAFESFKTNFPKDFMDRCKQLFD